MDVAKRKKQIKKLEKAILQHQQETNSLQADNRLNVYKLQEADRERNLLREELKNLKEKYEKEKEERVKHETNYRIMEMKEKNMNQEHEKLSKENTELKRKLEETSTVNTNLREENTTTKIQLEESNRRAANLNEECRDQKEQIVRLSGEVDRMRDEAHGKTVELSKKEIRLNHLEVDTEEKARLLKEKEEQAAIERNKYEKDTKDFQENRMQINEEAAKATTSLTYEAEMRKKYEMKKEEYEKEVLRIKDTVQTLRMENSSLSTKVGSLEEFKARATKSEEEMRKKIDDLQEQRNEAVNERSELRGQLTEQDKEYQKQVEEFTERIQTLSMENDKLSKKSSIKDQRACKITPGLCDMELSQRDAIIDIVDQMVNRYDNNLEIAVKISEALEEQYGSSWHCVLGTASEVASSVAMSGESHILLNKGTFLIQVFQT